LTSVKKTKAEVAAQKATHAAKDKLRKERREEQERNVQRKNAALSEKGNASTAVGTDEVEGGEEEEENSWDEDEEISEGEVSGDDEDEDDEVGDGDEDEDEDEVPPTKKAKLKKQAR
jgi:ribosome biogenesis protein SSF1/2